MSLAATLSVNNEENCTGLCANCGESQRQKVGNQANLDRRVSNIFITIGMPANIKGYKFLREAVRLCVDSPALINSITNKLYPMIAEKFDTGHMKVERAIRHAIEVCWNKGRGHQINEIFKVKAFCEKDRPTNGEFIAFVSDKMLLEAC